MHVLSLSSLHTKRLRAKVRNTSATWNAQGRRVCSCCHLTPEPENNAELSRTGLQAQSGRRTMVKNRQDLDSAIAAWTSGEQRRAQPLAAVPTGMSGGPVQRESPALTLMCITALQEKRNPRGTGIIQQAGFQGSQRFYSTGTPLGFAVGLGD